MVISPTTATRSALARLVMAHIFLGLRCFGCLPNLACCPTPVRPDLCPKSAPVAAFGGLSNLAQKRAKTFTYVYDVPTYPPPYYSFISSPLYSIEKVGQVRRK